MKVTKEITFDSAHMLSDYQGQCHNLHGHTYKLQVTLEGDVQKTGNEECMVMDFNTLKEYLNSIVNSFDHAIIFSAPAFRSEAEEELHIWADKYGMDYVEVYGKSTSENIASTIKDRLREILGTDAYHISIRLWETPTSFVEV